MGKRSSQQRKPEYTFSLKKFRGVSCDSFTIRETDGYDEEMAVDSASKEEGNISPKEQILRMAIPRVDGRRVEGGMFLGLATWNSRTRTLALQAYEKVNSVTPKDLADFLKQGEPAAESAEQ